MMINSTQSVCKSHQNPSTTNCVLPAQTHRPKIHRKMKVVGIIIIIFVKYFLKIKIQNILQTALLAHLCRTMEFVGF